MRCPTCGTENTPDSRFCGGCGAKLTPEHQSRVAPTAKIPDDAPFPPSRPGASVANYAQPTSLAPPSIAPPTYSPASIPPTNNPASIPPNSYQAPAYNPSPASIPPNTYQARPAEPSISMPALPRTRWGMVILVLLMDLGLATAGAILLQRGLAKDDADSGSGSGSAKPAATTTSTAAPPPAPGAPAKTVPAPPLAASLDALAKTADDNKDEGKPVDKKPAPPAQANKQKVVKPAGGGGTPQDPYDEKRGLGAEIELSAARSRGDFDQCYQAAQATMQMKSRIDIGFTVLPDGRVGKVHVVANSTGVPSLATCLGDAIERWAFAEHPAKPTEFVRPFIYN